MSEIADFMPLEPAGCHGDGRCVAMFDATRQMRESARRAISGRAAQEAMEAAKNAGCASADFFLGIDMDPRVPKVSSHGPQNSSCALLGLLLGGWSARSIPHKTRGRSQA